MSGPARPGEASDKHPCPGLGRPSDHLGAEQALGNQFLCPAAGPTARDTRGSNSRARAERRCWVLSAELDDEGPHRTTKNAQEHTGPHRTTKDAQDLTLSSTDRSRAGSGPAFPAQHSGQAVRKLRQVGPQSTATPPCPQVRGQIHGCGWPGSLSPSPAPRPQGPEARVIHTHWPLSMAEWGHGRGDGGVPTTSPGGCRSLQSDSPGDR